ncbi:hypothetical protein [Aeromonas sp.]|nr:hypothetical protein [Aeromonas sp.]MDU7582311.1 hypothetical protein [Aeromonas sp.]
MVAVHDLKVTLLDHRVCFIILKHVTAIKHQAGKLDAMGLIWSLNALYRV